MKESNL
jgi:hypothetical protein